MAERILEVASNEYGYRRLKDSSRYNSLIPKTTLGEYVKLSGWIEPNRTVGFMCEIIRTTLEDTRDLAAHLKGKTLYETCGNIWKFLHDHIQYKLEKGEQLRRPSRSWHKDKISGIDCDCFSIFAGSILSNLGITYYIRIAGYAGSPSYQHVYIVVKTGGNEIILDPVLHKFNTEKTPLFYKDTIMQGTGTFYLNGFTEPAPAPSQAEQELFARASEPLLSALIATRQQLAENPHVFDNNSDMKAGDSIRIVDALDNLIRIYGTPEFDQLLDQYIMEGIMNGLGNIGTGVQNFFGGIKTAVSNIKTNVQTAVNNVKDKIDDSGIIDKLKEGAKDVIHNLNKFNPVLAAGRGLVLVVLRFNACNLAAIFLSHIRKNTEFGKFVLNVWEFGGGNPEKFKLACEEGSNLKGFGEIVTATVVAGTPAATMIGTMVAKGIATGALKMAGDVIVGVGDAIMTPTPTTPTSPNYSTPRPSYATVPVTNTRPVTNIIAPAPPITGNTVAPPTGFTKKLNGPVDDAGADLLNEELARAVTGDENKKGKFSVQQIQAFFEKIWEAIKKALGSKGVKEAVIREAVDQFTNQGANVPYAPDQAYNPNQMPDSRPTDRPASTLPTDKEKETFFRDENGNIKKGIVATGIGVGGALLYGIYWYYTKYINGMNGYDDYYEYEPSRLR